MKSINELCEGKGQIHEVNEKTTMSVKIWFCIASGYQASLQINVSL